MLLVLARVVFLESESLGTRDHIYCLRFETSLFIASYDSQGRINLSSFTDWVAPIVCSIITLHGPSREHRLQWLLCCCRGMFTALLHTNGCCLVCFQVVAQQRAYTLQYIKISLLNTSASNTTVVATNAASFIKFNLGGWEHGRACWIRADPLEESHTAASEKGEEKGHLSRDSNAVNSRSMRPEWLQ
jgi:hypothetical protein